MSESPRDANSSSKPPVVVLGSGLTALGVLRSLAAFGAASYLVDDTDSIAAHSRWAKGRVIKHPESRDPANLQSLLDELPLSKAVLMACSDKWTAAVSALPAEARGRFLTSMPPMEAVRLVGDKTRFAETLERLQVAHPWTRAISTEDDLAAIPADRWPDLFLKPADSQTFSQHFGVKAFSASGPEDALASYRRMQEIGVDAVVQEYVPGPSDQHYFIDGFIDKDRDLKGLHVRQRTRMFPRDYGNSSFMVTIDPETVAGAVADLKTLLRDLNYRGIFSAEFKQDPRDGVFRIIEINARPWWHTELAMLNGVNVCELVYLDAQGLPTPERLTFPIGVRHMRAYADFQAFKSYRRDGLISLWSWLRDFWRASDATFRGSDPFPALSLLRKFPQRAIRKLSRLVRRQA